MTLSKAQQHIIEHFQQLPETLPANLVEASRERIGVFWGIYI